MRTRSPTVLFVCTGNIFRSLSAEHALRTAFNEKAGAHPHKAMNFASAGTHANPERLVRDDVLKHVARQGANAAAHRPRRLNQAIIDGADIIIAMDKNHQDYIRQTFNREAHLFMQVAHFMDVGVPDLPDVITNHRQKPEESDRFIGDTVDMIFAARHRFLHNLNLLLPRPGAPKTTPGPDPRPA